MDILTEVLRPLRLTGGVFIDAQFTAPWSVSSCFTYENHVTGAPVAQLVAYHFVVEGRVRVELAGAPPLVLHPGELVLFPRNDLHVLSSEAGLQAIPADSLIERTGDDALATIRHGGGGEPAAVVCGFLASDEPGNPLLDALPPVLTLDLGALPSRAWVESTMRFAARALATGSRDAATTILPRLAESLLVEAIRLYASSPGSTLSGWLRAMRDPQVGRALAAIHADVAAPWTIEQLARTAATSRTRLVERFTQLVGVPPMRYLARWRMHMARLRLRESQDSVAQVARAVGYESEAAFSRAFKRESGQAPASWRRRAG